MKKRFGIFPPRAFKSSANIDWQRALESPPVIRSVFIRLILSLTDGLTKEWCIATHLFWKVARRIGRASGWLHLALYLKQARVALQKYVAGEKAPPLNVYVSLTRTGLPRIIPSYHRRAIRNGSADIIRLYMSLFSLSKLIALAARPGQALLDSITQPTDLGAVSEFVAHLRPMIKPLLLRYVPTIGSIPLMQGLRFVPTWKSVPTISWYKGLLKRSQPERGGKFRRADIDRATVFITFPYELAAFQGLMNFVHARGEQWSQGALWPPYIRYPFDPFNKVISGYSLEWFERRIGPFLPSCEDLGIPPLYGRLCSSCTGDGKRRLFAIGNYVNQRLLAPLHDWLASVLKRIPMDGTFDQTKPLDLMAGLPGRVYSIDLKAATDRWPLLLLFELCQAIFDRSFASSAVNSALATNIFDVTFLRTRRSVSFVAGQPLGYLSSWPLFALSHHLVVWWAAEQIYPGERFKHYAILGDDIVIADERVALMYIRMIDDIRVKISTAKSLVSSSGACEFAKRFRIDRMRLDVSPLSVKKILRAHDPIGWYNFMLTVGRPLRLSTRLRIAGLGFKACSRPLISKKHGIKAKRLLAMLSMIYAREIGLELAISSFLGYWISPQVVGRIVSELLDHYWPKDPVEPPLELFPYPGMRDMNEYSLYHSWMRQYLDYLKWNVMLRVKPAVGLDDFLDIPIYIRYWSRPEVDVETFRYGVLFRIFDKIDKYSQENSILLLPVKETSVWDLMLSLINPSGYNTIGVEERERVQDNRE